MTARTPDALLTLFPAIPPASISNVDSHDVIVSAHHDFQGGKVVDGDFYVCATHGDDTNAGTTINDPFKTVQKAADTVSAGDLCYARGGVYTENLAFAAAGTAANRITFRNYPGEVPIIDGTGSGGNSMVDIEATADFFTLDGFVIQGNDFTGGAGLRLLDGASDSQVRNILSQRHDNTGVVIGDVTGAVLLEDVITRYNGQGGGGSGDGLNYSNATGSTPTLLRRIISYQNNDDNFDLFQSSDVVLVDCVSYLAGYLEDMVRTAGDGEGFKQSVSDVGGSHTYIRCMAYQNGHRGFDSGNGTKSEYHHCDSFENDNQNWNMDNAIQDLYLCTSSNPGAADQFHASARQWHCSWSATNPN